MRPNSAIANQMIGPIMSGNELEGLADMLKSEITASLSHLVDTIVTRFLNQKRFMGKQSEAAAAAAEQLSKDLMMATQLLDRKSPRTKVADRPTGPNQSGESLFADIPNTALLTMFCILNLFPHPQLRCSKHQSQFPRPRMRSSPTTIAKWLP